MKTQRGYIDDGFPIAALLAFLALLVVYAFLHDPSPRTSPAAGSLDPEVALAEFDAAHEKLEQAADAQREAEILAAAGQGAEWVFAEDVARMRDDLCRSREGGACLEECERFAPDGTIAREREWMDCQGMEVIEPTTDRGGLIEHEAGSDRDAGEGGGP